MTHTWVIWNSGHEVRTAIDGNTTYSYEVLFVSRFNPLSASNYYAFLHNILDNNMPIFNRNEWSTYSKSLEESERNE